MQPTLIATTFVVVSLAELPDKSLIASLVLSTRFKGVWVWAGVSAAFVVHVVLAVLAGGLLTLLPHVLVQSVVAVLFALGAAVLLRPERLLANPIQDPDIDREIATAVQRVGGHASPLRVVATCFGVVFVGEWGDVTQLATANLAARYGDPLSVGLGAGLALIAVAGVAVLAGGRLLRNVPLLVVRRCVGVVLGVLAVVTLLSLLL